MGNSLQVLNGENLANGEWSMVGGSEKSRSAVKWRMRKRLTGILPLLRAKHGLVVVWTHGAGKGATATGGSVWTGGVVRSAIGRAVAADLESVERSESRGRAALLTADRPGGVRGGNASANEPCLRTGAGAAAVGHL
jgi:hypothetical protein